ncbi:Stf0 family sulfotransferase [Acaryochloris sp. IP29b_bin.137]|uniref:Stf0 family sulfotransferase n=1 Tax=Acaryochloris sp. IP29b_bin.137 TaxID=2969217 RepID=UPI00261996F9|nr:Stf0 family sulfotransferase [Acaryochloris sp. IP29b_bin.137]
MFQTLSKAVHDPSKALSILTYQLSKPFGHYEYQKFMVLTRSRTGSNLLISLLNSHPLIHAEYEAFAKLRGETVEQRFGAVYSKQPSTIKAVGFKLFYYHPLDDKHQFEALWNRIIQDKAIRIIHLKRKNKLRMIVSRTIAEQQEIWSQKETPSPQAPLVKSKPIMLSTVALEKEFLASTDPEIQFANRLRGHPILDIYYEDIVENMDTATGQIFDFLGLPPCQPQTSFRKQNIEPLSKLVSNYASLKQYFAGSQWESFFES